MNLRELLNKFSPTRKSSAEIAKERLQIIVAHESARDRGSRGGPGIKGIVDLQKLKEKLIRVIAEDIGIPEHQVTVELERDNERSILELNVILPDRV